MRTPIVPLLGLALLSPACGVRAQTPPKPITAADLEKNPGLRPLKFQTSWIGNTFGFGDGKHVQNDIWYLWTAPDGTCYTGAAWDEGHFAGGIYKNGDQLGTLQDTFQDFVGVSSVVGDGDTIYAGRGGAIRPYHRDGSRAGADVPLPAKAFAQGLATDGARHRLIVSDSGNNQVLIYSLPDLQPKARWSVPRAGRLAAASDGSLWIVQRADLTHPAQIAHYAASGTPLPGAITGPAGFDPTGLCFDGKGRLLIADNGPEQNVKIYGFRNGTPFLGGTLGAKGGIYAGPTPGRVGPLRFCGLTGVGADAAGNVYVSQNRYGPQANGYALSGSVLECYQPSGKRGWILHGLEFVDCADADPTTEQGDRLEVYTKLSHYALDLSQPNGHQWTWVGHTLDPFRYPTDERVVSVNDNGNIRGAAWVRVLKGRRFLFLTDMASSRLTIYRFSAQTGEIAIPCGRIDLDHVWRDADGNGREDAGETQTGPGVPPALFVSYWVDSAGDLWETSDGSNNSRVRHFSLQGLDAHGSPVWDYAHFEQEDAPAPFKSGDQNHGCYRVQYEPATDTLYLTGYSPNLTPGRGYGSPAYAVKNVGPVVARYDGWRKGKRTPKWATILPSGGPNHDNEHASPAAFHACGDYFFVGYEGLFDDANSGRIQVYRTSDGGYVGTLHAGPESGNIEGAMDIPYGVRAFKRANGEYLIFSEDDWHAKVLMYRWTPGK